MMPRLLLPLLGVTAACLSLLACGVDETEVSTGTRVITLAADSASNPTAAYDKEREIAYLAWVGVDRGTAAVFLSRLDGGGRTSPVRVNDIPGDAAPHLQAPPQVAVAPNGRVYVLWQNNTPVEGRRFPASDLRLAASDDGGRSFTPAITVNDDAGGPPSSHTFHDIAIGGDGTVYVSWIDSRARDAVAHQRSPVRDAGPHGEAVHPVVGADGRQQTVTASHGHAGHETPDGPEIRVARSTDGGRTFGASEVVDSGACPCCRTSIVVGSDGAAYVAWRKIFPGNIRDVVVARAEAGTLRFSEPVRVYEDGWEFPGCPHAGPSLAVGEGGRLLVGWYTGEEERQGLWYAASSDEGRSFAEPSAVLTGGWVPPSQIRLTMVDGRVWAAWDDRTSENPVVRIATGRIGGTLESDPAWVHEGSDPALASTRDGVLFAWLDGTAARAGRLKQPRAARRSEPPPD